MNVALYLRKSRADEDAERRGEGETSLTYIKNRPQSCFLGTVFL